MVPEPTSEFVGTCKTEHLSVQDMRDYVSAYPPWVQAWDAEGSGKGKRGEDRFQVRKTHERKIL